MKAARSLASFGPRALRTAVLLLVPAAIGAYSGFGIGAGVSLTATVGVAIVHFLWLERFLATVLAGEAPKFRRRDGLKILLQFALLTGLAALAGLWKAFSPAGAIAGVTVVVAAVTIEGFRTTSTELEG